MPLRKTRRWTQIGSQCSVSQRSEGTVGMRAALHQASVFLVISSTAGSPILNSLLPEISEPSLKSSVSTPSVCIQVPTHRNFQELHGPIRMLASIPCSVTVLASPATNRGWRRKQVLVTRTWDGRDLGRKETPALTLLPRHWGARASFCKNSFFSSFRDHGAPALSVQPRPTGPRIPWEARGQKPEHHPSSPEESWLVPGAQRTAKGPDKLCMLMARGLRKQALCWGKAAAGAPALCWPWLDPEWMAAVLPLFQGRALDRMPPQAGPVLPQATLSHLCPARGDPGEHLLQAAHRLNIRANLDQQVLLKCANHLLFLSCF
ncbi:PREDICTED: uncharacterized protein LOC109392902 [Hipposideros armiger]|uniref:Uncharacterized protein LOC109392902 n=1 Tax=Hipposideros armiger TaxID=186990 RepID=A0A8B7SY81_HIPAR|nr:PREDICTED: uncharacterized protein LOC109392902 [Hipposideros armiger]